MTAFVSVLVSLVAVTVLYVLLRKPVREYFRMRGDRVVACPETSETVAVRVNARHAALTAAGGHEQLSLEACTRWPVKGGCGQECLKQIEAQPMDCLVKTQVTRWYADRECVICGSPLGSVHWTEHKPALRAPDGTTLEWREVAPEKLYDVMATHQAICWDCHVSETFRRARPDLVIDNPHPSQSRH
jgi:hypothetical protein